MEHLKISGKPEHLLTDVRITTEFSFKSIPQTIVINNNKYRIAGVISYEREQKHYKAYTWHNHWYVYDDLRTHRTVPKAKEKVCLHVLLYIL